MTETNNDIVRDMAGETVCGFRVSAYRETHPEHGDKYGHRYSEHWSTPSTNPAVTVERLFTEAQLREAVARVTALEAALKPLLAQFDAYRESGGSHADAHNLLVRYGLWDAALAAVAKAEGHA